MLLLFFRQTEHLKDSAPEVQVVSFIHDADWWKGANEERKVNQEREERRRAKGIFEGEGRHDQTARHRHEQREEFGAALRPDRVREGWN